MAKAANVKQLVIFHHDPIHNDDFMDQVALNTKAAFPNSVIAKEGMSIDLMATDHPAYLETA